jgi:hypothetical protein
VTLLGTDERNPDRSSVLKSASAADGALTGTSLPVRPPGREQGATPGELWSPASTRFLFLFEEAA